MESCPRESASYSAVLPCTSEERPTWFAVDIRFVITTIILFGVAVATTVRFAHEVFDPLAESFLIQGWAAVIARIKYLMSY